ncbi:MAG: hypothetical protein ACE5KF_11485, partial [Kiloniellaceae bacterium]
RERLAAKLAKIHGRLGATGSEGSPGQTPPDGKWGHSSFSGKMGTFIFFRQLFPGRLPIVFLNLLSNKEETGEKDECPHSCSAGKNRVSGSARAAAPRRPLRRRYLPCRHRLLGGIVVEAA